MANDQKPSTNKRPKTFNYFHENSHHRCFAGHTYTSGKTANTKKSTIERKLQTSRKINSIIEKVLNKNFQVLNNEGPIHIQQGLNQFQQVSYH